MMMNPYRRTPYRLDTRGWIQERYFTLTNFSGGLNNVEPDNLIGDNESTDCKNMRFLDDVIMEKRHGIKLVETYTKLSEPVTWLDVYRPLLKNNDTTLDNNGKLVRGTSNALYIDNKKICDTNGDVRGVTYIGKYYFVDGKSLRVYNNDKCYRIIREPIEHLSEKADKGSTKLKFKKIPEIVKVGSPVMILAASVNQTSNFSTKVKSITNETGVCTVELETGITGDCIATTPVFFYTPKSGKNVVGEEVWDDENLLAYYLPCELEIADDYAGESYFPDSPNVITVHNSRLFISGDSTQPHGIYMSRTSQPLYFPSNAGISVKPDGTPIIDLVVFDNALIIGRQNDMYVLYGNSEYQTSASDPYYIKQMDVSCGFMSDSCGALLNNYYIYLGSDGRFYKLNTPTTYVEYLMTSPLPHKCDIYAKPLSVSRNAVINVYSVAYRNEIYFVINNEFTIVYSYDNMSFTYFKGWKERCLKVHNNKLYIGRSDGNVAVYCDNEDVFNDVGDVIECRYDTKRFDFNNGIMFKYYKKFMLTSHAWDEVKSKINVDIEIDGCELNIDKTISSNASRFDNSNWDEDTFDGSNLYRSKYYNLDVRGRTIKFFFSNSGLDESMRLYDVNILYSIRDVR